MAEGLWSIMGPSLATGALSSVANFATMAYQNKFNAEQAQVARDWNLEVDNSKYQRAVTDMRKAGVNPALMMSKGPISTQAASNISAQGASPAYTNLSAIASLAQSISAAKLNASQARNLDEDSNLKRSKANYYDELGDKVSQETLMLITDNKYRDQFNQLEIQGKKNANAISEKQIKEIEEKINNLIADTAKKIAEAKTEEEKANLCKVEAILKGAQAYQIAALVPFQQESMSSQSVSQRAVGKVHLVEAAFKQGLIDAGAIEAQVRQLNASASKQEIDAIVQETLHTLGYEGAQVSNTQSQTFKNYSGAVADVINGLASSVGTVIGSFVKFAAL